MFDLKPHVLIRKGAVLQGVRLSGITIILETENVLEDREGKEATTELLKVISPESKDVQITDCGILSLGDISRKVTNSLIDKSKYPLKHLLKRLTEDNK